jgi:hypothetical protein
MSAPRRTVLVAVVAVLGIAIAAAITWGTSQLVRQRIGLASEPLTAGRRLLPPAPTQAQSTPAQVTRPATGNPTRGASSGARAAPTTSTARPSPPATTTAAPSSVPGPPVTSTAAPSSASSPPSEEVPVEHRPTVRGSQDGGGDHSSHRDD